MDVLVLELQKLIYCPYYQACQHLIKAGTCKSILIFKWLNNVIKTRTSGILRKKMEHDLLITVDPLTVSINESKQASVRH